MDYSDSSFLTIKQVCEILLKSDPAVRRLIRKGKLRAVNTSTSLKREYLRVLGKNLREFQNREYEQKGVQDGDNSVPSVS